MINNIEILDPYGFIYMTTNMINGKKYIGSSKDVYNRWNQHLTELRKGKHTKHIQAAYYKYGEESFVFMVIELVYDLTQLVPREQIWLDYYESYKQENGYNIREIAESNRGIKWSEESKVKLSELTKNRYKDNPEIISQISESVKNLWEDPEYKNRMKDAIKKGLDNPEVKAIMSKSTKDRWENPKFKDKILEIMRSPESRQIGSILRKKEWEDPDIRSKRVLNRANTIASDPEFSRKASESATNQWADPEMRSNMLKSLSQSIKEKWNNPEYRRKNIESNTGKQNSEESKSKLSKTMKQLWSDPKSRAKVKEGRERRKFKKGVSNGGQE